MTLFCFFFFVIKQNQGSTLGAEVVFNFQLRQSKESFNSNSHTTISFILAYSPIWLPMNSRIPVLPDPPICPIEIILERAYLKNAKLDLLNLSFLFSVNGPFWERHLWRVNWTSSHLPDPPEGPKMENFNRRVSQSLACWMLNWKGLTLRRL